MAARRTPVEIDPDTLKRKLSYDPCTGIFTWSYSSRNTSIGAVAGSVNSVGYRYIRINSKAYLAHRLAWLYSFGVWPKDLDHMDGNKDHNALSNLREVTTSENNQNRHRAQANGTSKFLGVTETRTGRWQAQIGVNGTCKYLGTFSTTEEASAAYVTAKLILHAGYIPPAHDLG